jgi:uncharacterized protein YigE (DUF2233 family)
MGDLRQKIKVFSVILGLLIASCVHGPATAELKSINDGGLTVDVCQIDLSKDTVRMVWNAADGVFILSDSGAAIKTPDEVSSDLEQLSRTIRYATPRPARRWQRIMLLQNK